MTYSKGSCKAIELKHLHVLEKLSGNYLPIQTLPDVAFKHILISLTTIKVTQNSMRILYNTSLLTES
jgi:hypothetical protein